MLYTNNKRQKRKGWFNSSQFNDNIYEYLYERYHKRSE